MMAAKPKKKVVRPPKHPWDEVIRLYVQGEDSEVTDKAGTRIERVWPTQADLAGRYNIRQDSICRRFAIKDIDGKNPHDLQAAFKTDHKRQCDAKMASDLADREIGFRAATMAVAEMGLRQVAVGLARPQGSETLSRLMTAAKRAQEMGLVALDRPANGSEGTGGQGMEDWSLMHEVRRGARAVPTEEGGKS